MKIKLGILFIIVGLSLFLYNCINDRREVVTEVNKINNSLSKEISYRYIDDSRDDLYFMILSIPQIDLKKGIYDKLDERNNLDLNVVIHEKSDYPDYDNGNVILYAHSGSGKKAFFKDLYKLNTDSLVELYYNHTKYVYKIDTIYNVIKNGTVKIHRDQNKKTITLITCSQTNKSEQIVFIGYLIDEINY